MGEIFDIVIIGASIGGLTAAYELKGNCKFIVIEKLHRPGGTSYSFKMKEYEFLTGPLGFSYPDFINSWFKRNELGELNFSRTDYQLIAVDMDLIKNISYSNGCFKIKTDKNEILAKVVILNADLKNVFNDGRGAF